MMMKRDDSLRSQGMTMIATDTPTRAKLKAQAAAAGLTMAEYIRYLADKASEGQQGVMVPTPPAVAISELNKKVDDLSEAVKSEHVLLKAFWSYIGAMCKLGERFPLLPAIEELDLEEPPITIGELIGSDYIKGLYSKLESEQLRFKDGDQECQGETQ